MAKVAEVQFFPARFNGGYKNNKIIKSIKNNIVKNR